MTGKPDYGPGDLIAAIKDSNRYPIKQGQTFICEAISPAPDSRGVWGVRLQGLHCPRPRSDGFFSAHMFKKVDPLPPEMWSRDVDIDLLAEREKEDA